MTNGILYTSYLANHRIWKPLNLYNISVMLYTPKWWNLKEEGIDRLSGLTPGTKIFKAYKNGFINSDQFREMFLDRLSNDEDSIRDMTTIKKALDQGIDILLLCTEKRGEFCHRHIIAEVFDEMGYKTQEL